MKVFVSWSGERSKSVASALKNWLADALPHLEVWMSAHDIHAGDPWTNSLHQRLRNSDFGILCLTEANLGAPWLLYEAGALIMSVEAGRVVPFLIDLDPGQVKQPLSQLQGVAADREGTFRLLHGLNDASELKLPDDRLKKTFDKWWPDLESLLTLPVETRIQDGVAIVRPRSSRLLGDEIQRFHDVLLSVTDRGLNRIVIDLSTVEFLASPFLATLAVVMKRTRAAGGDVALAAPFPETKEIFAITHFDQIIACCDTVDEAVKRVRPSSA